MPIQIRLSSHDVDELIAVSSQLGACLGDRVEMNRLRDGHRDAGIVYGTWRPTAEWAAPRVLALTAPGTWPSQRTPIQIRLISSDPDELLLAGERLLACLHGQVDLHPARDSRNGEWIVYATWTPAPPAPIAALEPATWPQAQVAVLESAYS